MIVAAVAVVTSCNRTTPDPVAQAQDAVDAVNERIEQYGSYGEEP